LGSAKLLRFSAILGKNLAFFAVPQVLGAIIPKGRNTKYVQHSGEVWDTWYQLANTVLAS